jgi:hypothetical protein
MEEAAAINPSASDLVECSSLLPPAYGDSKSSRLLKDRWHKVPMAASSVRASVRFVRGGLDRVESRAAFLHLASRHQAVTLEDGARQRSHRLTRGATNAPNITNTPLSAGSPADFYRESKKNRSNSSTGAADRSLPLRWMSD